MHVLRAHRLTELERLRIVSASVGLVSIAEQSVQISCMLLLKRSAVSNTAMGGCISVTGNARIVQLEPCAFTTVAHCLHVRDGIPVTPERLAGIDSRIVGVEASVYSKPQKMDISSTWLTVQDPYVCPCPKQAAVCEGLMCTRTRHMERICVSNTCISVWEAVDRLLTLLLIGADQRL